VTSLTEIVYRPRSVTEILDVSAHLLRDHFISFATLSAIAYFPFAVVSFLWQRYEGISAEVPVPALDWSFLGIMLLQIVLFQLMTGVITTLASRAYLQEPVDPGSTWQVALRRLPAITFSGLIVLIACFIGAVFLFFPAIYIYTRYSLAPTIAAIEGTGTTASLSRASILSKGNKGHIFGVFVLTFVIYFIVGIGLVALGAIVDSLVLKTFFGFAASVIVWPMLPTIQTVLYYDLRIRAEGYDVDLMSRGLDPMSPSVETAL
jgi:hypothetical protein